LFGWKTVPQVPQGLGGGAATIVRMQLNAFVAAVNAQFKNTGYENHTTFDFKIQLESIFGLCIQLLLAKTTIRNVLTIFYYGSLFTSPF
jgi:hypothetical protein